MTYRHPAAAPSLPSPTEQNGYPPLFSAILTLQPQSLFAPPHTVSVDVYAHGALGAYDEVIFISVAAIFLVMMGVSWVRARGIELDDPDEAPRTTAPADTPAPAEDRFELR